MRHPGAGDDPGHAGPRPRPRARRYEHLRLMVYGASPIRRRRCAGRWTSSPATSCRATARPRPAPPSRFSTPRPTAGRWPARATCSSPAGGRSTAPRSLWSTLTGKTAADRRGRRDRRPGPADHAVLLAAARGDRGRPGRRLAPHRRRRPPRRRRVPVHLRPGQGHDRLRRRERLPPRDRRRDQHPSTVSPRRR